ncbi:MAG: hypothetical protein K2O13_06510 [Lachnospiraceae bacterium]|nr:hypothetical protein [Lachnospiraceae bacterium]
MGEKNTDDLEKVLQSTHIKNFDAYCRENAGCLIEGDFTVYIPWRGFVCQGGFFFVVCLFKAPSAGGLDF